jgi:type IV pilus biogenesis protein CpaD/CtpE
MTIDRKIVFAGAALLALAGCTPNDTGIGDAARANYAAQIVDPEPQHAKAMTADGSQVAGAQDRYRKGEVKKPVGVKTTSGGSGGGSGRSGSSSGGN